MPLLHINPTRASLLILKKKLRVAERGYKLLKDKRDGLMKKFMPTVRETITLQKSVEEKLGAAFAIFALGKAMMPKKVAETAFLLTTMRISLDAHIESIVSVKVPKFDIKKEGAAFSYGFLDTRGDLDRAIRLFENALEDIIRLAELEKRVELIAEEIERTRRRVSSLENIMIPNINQTIKFITQRLEEQARDGIVSIMRVKAMILAKTI